MKQMFNGNIVVNNLSNRTRVRLLKLLTVRTELQYQNTGVLSSHSFNCFSVHNATYVCVSYTLVLNAPLIDNQVITKTLIELCWHQCVQKYSNTTAVSSLLNYSTVTIRCRTTILSKAFRNTE